MFRYAFEVAETSFDPHKVSDLYSNILNSAMFDAPLRYDYLARPLKLVPNTLAAMPEISADGMTYTMHVKPGIYFADDPAFNGKKRELTAQDYVYSIKRLMDPKVRASQLGEIEGYVAGTDEALAKARKANQLDYDAPVEGLKALDRYTWQIKLTQPFYIFIYNLADCRISCAFAREVVEHYGDDIGSHPVGTGAYRLAFWKRSSKMVFEANPNFREEYFDGEPGADDAEGQAILALQKGKRLPMIGRVEVYVIEETQPRWLSFLNEEMDLMYGVPEEYANQAMPNNKLAPNLAKRGITMKQVPALDLTYMYFNMEDPVVGGYTPEKVALRRAISLAYNTRDEIAILRKNQAIPAQTPYSPGVAGYDPDLPHHRQRVQRRQGQGAARHVRLRRSRRRRLPRDARRHAAGAQVELDAHGARPADGRAVEAQHGRHRHPHHVPQGQVARPAQGSEQRQADDVAARRRGLLARCRHLAAPLYGPNIGDVQPRALQARGIRPPLREGARHARRPERTKVYQEMAKLIVAYAPWKINTHRILTDMWYPWVVGYRRPLVQSNNFWKYIDIDLEKSRVASR